MAFLASWIGKFPCAKKVLAALQSLGAESLTYAEYVAFTLKLSFSPVELCLDTGRRGSSSDRDSLQTRPWWDDWEDCFASWRGMATSYKALEDLSGMMTWLVTTG